MIYKKLFVICVMLIAITSVMSMAETPVIKIAVVRFDNISKDSKYDWLGTGFAETLSTKLANVSGIQYVERQQMASVLKELHLQDSALIDENSAKKIGKLAGADFVIVGSFQKIGESLKADARIVNVETGICGSGVDITGKFDSVFDLQANLALKLINILNFKPTQEEESKINKKEIDSLTAYELFSKGNEYYYKSDYDKAIENYTKAIKLNSKNSFYYSYMADSYLYKSDYDRAIENYTKAIDLAPQNADNFSDRSNAYLIKGEYNKTIEDCNVAIKLNNKHFCAYNNRGAGYYRIGDYDKAISDYNKAIELNPSKAILYYNRGLVYHDKNDYDKAISDYSKAIELNPSTAVFYYNRGSAYYTKNEYDKAVSDYSATIELDPKNAKAYYNRGLGYCVKGDYNKAIYDIEYAIKLKPDNENYRNVLVSIMEKRGKE